MLMPDIMVQLGIDPSCFKTHNTLQDLAQTSPAMCVGVPTNDFEYAIGYSSNNKSDRYKLKKNNAYVMTVSMYESLQFDKSKNKMLSPSGVFFKNIYKKYNGQDLTNKSLLVWRTGGIGDLLFIQPQLQYLRDKYNCKISFCTAVNYFCIVKQWACIDSYFSFPIELDIFKQYDYHLTFEGVIERTNEAKSLNCYKLFSKWMNIKPDDKDLVPKLYIDSTINNIVKSRLNRLGVPIKYVLIQPRASSPIRTPSELLWKTTINHLVSTGNHVVICDLPDKAAAVDAFINNTFDSNCRKKITNFSSYSKNLDYVLCLIKNSMCVIAPDSSFVHMAAALDCPCVGLYGPFSGDVRVSTYSKCIAVEPESSAVCVYGGKGCFTHGHSPCKFCVKTSLTNRYIHSPSPCFDNIKIEKIITAIRKVCKNIKV